MHAVPANQERFIVAALRVDGVRFRAAWCAVIALALPSLGRGETTCAVLPAAREDGRPTEAAALLEDLLTNVPGLRLVDRTLVESMLAEKEFGLAFDSGALKTRLQVGELLRAKLLVMMRETSDEHGRALQVVVAETDMGLRLLAESYPWSEQVQEKTLDDIRDAVAGIAARSHEPARKIVAIMPFECSDLTFDYAHRSGAYTKLVEAGVGRLSGVLLVEFEEARALAEELRVSGGPREVARPGPYYLMGSYANSGSGAQRRVRVEMKLIHNGETLAALVEPALSQTELPDFLVQRVPGLMGHLAQDPHTAASDRAHEVRTLRERADYFMRLGNWTDAYALIQAGLLLSPDDLDLRVKALLTCAGLVAVPLAHGASIAQAEADLLRRLRLYRFGFADLEAALRLAHFDGEQPEDPGYRRYHRALESYFWVLYCVRTSVGRGHAGDAMTQEFAHQLSEMLLRDFEEKTAHKDFASAPADRLILVHDFALREPPERNFTARLRAISAVLEAPQAEDRIVKFLELNEGYPQAILPAYQALLNNVEALPSEVARRAVARKRRTLENYLHPPKHMEYPKVTPKDDPPPDGECRVSLVGLELPFMGQEEWKRNRDFSVYWLGLESGVDFVSTYMKQFIMRDKGVLSPVAEVPTYIDSYDPPYDGRFVWVLIADERQPGFLLVEPGRGRVLKPKWPAGAPPYSGPFALSSVGPGRLCMAGGFERDFSRRSWIGLFETRDGTELKFTLIHGARFRPPGNRSEVEGFGDLNVVFEPHFMVTLSDPQSPEKKLVVLAKNSWEAIIIDPDRASVVLKPHLFASYPPDYGRLEYGGALYWAGIRMPPRGDLELKVFRLAMPDPEPVPIGTGICGKQLSQVLRSTHGVHLVGEEWWSAPDFDGPFIRQWVKLPGSSLERRYFRSSHFGHLLAVRSQGLFQVHFDESPSGSRAVDALAPASHRQEASDVIAPPDG